MPDHSKIRKVSLEEVLRLKRLERPEPAFWDQFEKQLREKQLAAIVAKRPWWQLDFGRVMAGVARARVPVGAAAVLTLTFLVVREYRAPKATVDQPSAADGLVVANSVVSEVSGEWVDSAEPATGATHPGMDLAAATVVSSTVTPIEAPSAAPSPTYAAVGGSSSDTEDSVMTLNRRVPWMGDAGGPSVHALVSGVTRSLEPALVTLQDASLAMPSVPRNRGQVQIATTSAVSLASEEPLAKLAGPANSQRARLATYVTAAFDAENRRSSHADHRARERAISRMSDEDLYSSASRIGVAGAAGGGLRLNF